MGTSSKRVPSECTAGRQDAISQQAYSSERLTPIGVVCHVSRPTAPAAETKRFHREVSRRRQGCRCLLNMVQISSSRLELSPLAGVIPFHRHWFGADVCEQVSGLSVWCSYGRQRRAGRILASSGPANGSSPGRPHSIDTLALGAGGGEPARPKSPDVLLALAQHVWPPGRIPVWGPSVG